MSNIFWATPLYSDFLRNAMFASISDLSWWIVFCFLATLAYQMNFRPIESMLTAASPSPWVRLSSSWRQVRTESLYPTNECQSSKDVVLAGEEGMHNRLWPGRCPSAAPSLATFAWVGRRQWKTLNRNADSSLCNPLIWITLQVSTQSLIGNVNSALSGISLWSNSLLQETSGHHNPVLHQHSVPLLNCCDGCVRGKFVW